MTLTVGSRLRALCAILWIVLVLSASTNAAEAMCDDVLSRIEHFLYPDEPAADDGGAPDRFWQKKAIHVVLFAGLAVLVSRALTGTPGAVWMFTVFIVVVVGTGSEAIQFIYPGREPALHDVLLNAASGGLTASVLILNRRRAAENRRAATAARRPWPSGSCQSPTNS